MAYENTSGPGTQEIGWGAGRVVRYGADNLVLGDGQHAPDGLDGQVVRDQNKLAKYKGEFDKKSQATAKRGADNCSGLSAGPGRPHFKLGLF